jgi:hypothetical protein
MLTVIVIGGCIRGAHTPSRRSPDLSCRQEAQADHRRELNSNEKLGFNLVGLVTTNKGACGIRLGKMTTCDHRRNDVSQSDPPRPPARAADHQHGRCRVFQTLPALGDIINGSAGGGAPSSNCWRTGQLDRKSEVSAEGRVVIDGFWPELARFHRQETNPFHRYFNGAIWPATSGCPPGTPPDIARAAAYTRADVENCFRRSPTFSARTT